jgi:hypothetical protein
MEFPDWYRDASSFGLWPASSDKMATKIARALSTGETMREP